MKTVAIVQARIGSTRLPGKVLFELAGRPMICLILERIGRAAGIDQVALATGDGPANDALAAVVADAGYQVVRGSEEDVLSRYRLACEATQADIVLRATGDCPFIDPAVLDALLSLRSREKLDYATNVKPETWPDGLDASVFTKETLMAADEEATLSSEREHVVPWMWKNCAFEGGSRLSSANLAAPADLSALRWTVDDGLDYRLARGIAETLGKDGAATAGWQQVLSAFQSQPADLLANQSTLRDEGYFKSLAKDGIEPSK